MSEAISSQDRAWMQQALELAALGQGWVEPNPMVGCVLVAENGSEIGSGFHSRFGGAHAERVAMTDAQTRGNREQLAGSTAYVTLEPCCHHGKTPPCTEALIEAGIRRVVVCMLDPFLKVSGKGCTQLRDHGVTVQVGLGQDEAVALNAPYVKRHGTALPWVIAKWAMSLDGKIATRTGNSQWISSDESRAFVHELRGRMDAIIVGATTAKVDDPLLTARTASPPQRTAIRIVADSSLSLPTSSKLVQTAGDHPTLLLAGPNATPDRIDELKKCEVEVYVSQEKTQILRVQELLQYLVVKRNATNVLVEGGSKLLGSLADYQMIDQCEVFLAPVLIGGAAAPTPVSGSGIDLLSDAFQFSVVSTIQRGPDVHMSFVR